MTGVTFFGRTAALLLAAAISWTAQGQQPHPERIYLSGQGPADAVTWEFRCSKGQRSGAWHPIAVPCNWELQGFGDYTYGRWYTVKEARPSDEEGRYRRRFDAPKGWRGQRIQLWFDGVMTDTEVWVNGRPAGEVHRGGFYRFGYDITDLVRFGGGNLLEVKVSKHSANKSVNAAERKADWWLYGGIYRPVWLEVVPQTHIGHFQLAADADGRVRVLVATEGERDGYRCRLSLRSLGEGRSLRTLDGAEYVDFPIDADETRSESRWNAPELWTPERPRLYTARIELRDPTGRTVQQREVRTGFRTVEFRPQDGIYLNGTRLILKGINRHSFSVDGGRATDPAMSREDALLIRAMNMNAVRSHYPPDEHFLDMCDSLGLLYVDELAGWHDAYDTQTGARLVREMVRRDVNHPSVILWSNGNEGGWNTKNDPLFARYDALQQRHTIHPWADFDDLDTHHYPAYLTGVGRFVNGCRVFLPTEFMHSLYDEGGGAGLRNFWDRWLTSPLFAGGFIWAFCDEAPKRTDRGGVLDSEGSLAPDGVLGPRREKEGSFYAIREEWSPVRLPRMWITPRFDGRFLVKNEYLYTNLADCRMNYTVRRVPSPAAADTASRVVARGPVTLPDALPGESRMARMEVPANFFDGDVLELEALGPDGQSLCTWSFPIRPARDYHAREKAAIQTADKTDNGTGNGTDDRTTDKGAGKTSGMPRAEAVEGEIRLSGGGVHVTFDAATGLLQRLAREDGTVIPLSDGPVAVGMKMRYLPDKSTLRNTETEAVYCARYLGGADSIVWRLTDDGALEMRALLLNRGSGGRGFDDAVTENRIFNLGLTFSYPESACTGLRWLGCGPYRVWKNRLAGARFGLWHKAWNDTVTGAEFETMVYPEFKGYHANLYWATLENPAAPLTLNALSDGIYLRLFTPREPSESETRSLPQFPAGDLSFLLEIPAIHSFKPIEQQGPDSQPGNIRIKQGDEGLHIDVRFDCGARR